jgi:hypothetical protein
MLSPPLSHSFRFLSFFFASFSARRKRTTPIAPRPPGLSRRDAFFSFGKQKHNTSTECTNENHKQQPLSFLMLQHHLSLTRTFVLCRSFGPVVVACRRHRRPEALSPPRPPVCRSSSRGGGKSRRAPVETPPDWARCAQLDAICLYLACMGNQRVPERRKGGDVLRKGRKRDERERRTRNKARGRPPNRLLTHPHKAHINVLLRPPLLQTTNTSPWPASSSPSWRSLPSWPAVSLFLVDRSRWRGERLAGEERGCLPPLLFLRCKRIAPPTDARARAEQGTVARRTFVARAVQKAGAR